MFRVNAKVEEKGDTSLQLSKLCFQLFRKHMVEIPCIQ